eukprot:760045-Hanusia_phi.AAC.4
MGGLRPHWSLPCRRKLARKLPPISERQACHVAGVRGSRRTGRGYKDGRGEDDSEREERGDVEEKESRGAVEERIGEGRSGLGGEEDRRGGG